jgi:pre-mRNA-splicing factor ISY1
MLFRFRAAQAAELGILDLGRTRRPKAITTISTIPECERWRGQVLQEISRKITRIQDPSLSDPQIRDINDEINKLMREKFVWELRIKDLGGPNFAKGGRVVDEDGKEIPGGGKGYRYFGRARDLPGVKELFEQAKRKAVGKMQDVEDGGPTRGELLSRGLDAGYYGYNLDEEDGTLLAYEGKREKEAADSMLKRDGDEESDEDWEAIPGDTGDGLGWALPTAEQVQEELVERRRRRLLDKLG